MRIIRPRMNKVSRYATLNRPHYICPECRVYIVRDREEDMFMCLQCGRKETRQEFRQTLIANVAEAQRAQQERREESARRDRLQRALRREEFREQFAVVYYIQLRDLIKIGTSTDIRGRLSDLPWDRLLLTEPGWYKKEGERHRQFADLQHDGEWFRADWPLLDFIDQRRQELREANRKRYGDRPALPWGKGDVPLPNMYEVLRNVHDELEWADAIQVGEIEHSGIYCSSDPADEVRY